MQPSWAPRWLKFSGTLQCSWRNQFPICAVRRSNILPIFESFFLPNQSRLPQDINPTICYPPWCVCVCVCFLTLAMQQSVESRSLSLMVVQFLWRVVCECLATPRWFSLDFCLCDVLTVSDQHADALREVHTTTQQVFRQLGKWERVARKSCLARPDWRRLGEIYQTQKVIYPVR